MWSCVCAGDAALQWSVVMEACAAHPTGAAVTTAVYSVSDEKHSHYISQTIRIIMNLSGAKSSRIIIFDDTSETDSILSK